MLKSFVQFLEEDLQVLQEQASGGAISNHNGALSEMGFHSAIKRYTELRTAGHSHDVAVNKLRTASANKNSNKLDRPISLSKYTADTAHEYHPRLVSAVNVLGHNDAQRTLWDAHHAAIDTIEHIHQHHGHIEPGSVTWTAPDSSGERTRAVIGHNTPADIVFKVRPHGAPEGESEHLRVGLGASLKYSKDQKVSSQKVRTAGYNSMNKIIQAAHRAVHGEDHHGLHNATAGMTDNSETQRVLGKHEKTLKDHFGENVWTEKEKIKDPTSFRRTRFGISRNSDGTKKYSINPGIQSHIRDIANDPTHPQHETFKPIHAELTAAKGDAEHYRNQVAAAMHSVIAGHSERSSSMDPSTRNRHAYRMIRQLSNIPEGRSPEAKGAKTLMVSINSGREKDNLAASNRMRPKTDIYDPSAAIDHLTRQARNSGLNAHHWLTPKTGGTGAMRVGPLEMSVDKSSSGVNVKLHPKVLGKKAHVSEYKND